MTSRKEVVVAEDVLAFAGIAPPRLRLYTVESHIAEKLHAYTMPRSRPNSRVKDLPDIALLASVRDIDSMTLRTAIERTFKHRATHPVPASAPAPPEAWVPVYARMAANDRLKWQTLDELTRAVQTFLDPLLAGEIGKWEAEAWAWSADQANNPK